MKYSTKKIIDFLDSDETKLSWDDFVSMLHNKFGDEIDCMLPGICDRVEYKYYRNDVAKHIEEIKKLANLI